MGRIEWTEHTWGPISGCSIESAGCTHCYAMRLAHRLGAMGQAGYMGLTRRTRGGPVWTGELRLAGPAQIDKPRRIRRPATIFVNSMSDLFHPEAPDEWRDQVYRVMRETPRHTYQILTKRPAVAAEYYAVRPELHGLPHVWLGVSVEDRRVLGRIDTLRTIPAGLRFLSVEPLIGPLGRLDLASISLVITGGESGPGARRCDPAWVRDVRDQCLAAGVAYFHKRPQYPGCADPRSARQGRRSPRREAVAGDAGPPGSPLTRAGPSAAHRGAAAPADAHHGAPGGREWAFCATVAARRSRSVPHA